MIHRRQLVGLHDSQAGILRETAAAAGGTFEDEAAASRAAEPAESNVAAGACRRAGFLRVPSHCAPI
jgi:hypothetical protein